VERNSYSLKANKLSTRKKASKTNHRDALIADVRENRLEETMIIEALQDSQFKESKNSPFYFFKTLRDLCLGGGILGNRYR
jgi:hypothetical protein